MESELIQKFLKRVRISEHCHEWEGKLGGSGPGYGIMPHGRKEKSIYAHRFSYQQFVGFIPDGLCVLHKCDNPSCVRPSHLFLGKQVDNMRDMSDKGRSRRGENGTNARLTWEEVKIIRELYVYRKNSAALAERFGVSAKYIARLASGRQKDRRWQACR